MYAILRLVKDYILMNGCSAGYLNSAKWLHNFHNVRNKVNSFDKLADFGLYDIVAIDSCESAFIASCMKGHLKFTKSKFAKSKFTKSKFALIEQVWYEGISK